MPMLAIAGLMFSNAFGMPQEVYHLHDVAQKTDNQLVGTLLECIVDYCSEYNCRDCTTSGSSSVCTQLTQVCFS
jgi:hypothetical protein